MPRVTPHHLSIASLTLLASACQGELDATLDILPQRYPNRLDAADTTVTAVVYSPPGSFAIPSDARALARAAEDPGGEGAEQALGEVVGDVAFRDVDGDGQRDAIARFAADDLRAAGLLSTPGGIEVRIEGDNLAWTGRDRLFDTDAQLVVLPEPSGPSAVGTASLLLHDAFSHAEYAAEDIQHKQSQADNPAAMQIDPDAEQRWQQPQGACLSAFCGFNNGKFRRHGGVGHRDGAGAGIY